MGIITSEQQGYYGSAGDHGNYRYIGLDEIIDSFKATYVGEGKLCEGVLTQDITFHAIRGLQELSYDTLRSTRDWEVVIPATLVLVMPVDFVNYVKLSWSDSGGIERVIYPTSKTSNPSKVSIPANEDGGFTVSTINTELGTTETSDTWTKYKGASTSSSTDSIATNEDLSMYSDSRYGIDPQYAQSNGSFFIDESLGRFHFSSNIAGKTVVVRYISDGVATENKSGVFNLDLKKSQVPKLAEEAIYKHILYGVLLARKDTPGGLLGAIKKERSAETRKAKLRLSNIKLEELTQALRGGSKIIKH
jgi:hypothetical protein